MIMKLFVFQSSIKDDNVRQVNIFTSGYIKALGLALKYFKANDATGFPILLTLD